MEKIPFSQAWAYCFGTTSYVVWLLIALIFSVSIICWLIRNYRKTQDWAIGHSLLLFVAIVAFFSALLIRPGEIAANTTKEQFNRGIIIGY